VSGYNLIARYSGACLPKTGPRRIRVWETLPGRQCAGVWGPEWGHQHTSEPPRIWFSPCFQHPRFGKKPPGPDQGQGQGRRKLRPRPLPGRISLVPWPAGQSLTAMRPVYFLAGRSTTSFPRPAGRGTMEINFSPRAGAPVAHTPTDTLCTHYIYAGAHPHIPHISLFECVGECFLCHPLPHPPQLPFAICGGSSGPGNHQGTLKRSGLHSNFRHLGDPLGAKKSPPRPTSGQGQARRKLRPHPLPGRNSPLLHMPRACLAPVWPVNFLEHWSISLFPRPDRWGTLKIIFPPRAGGPLAHPSKHTL